MMVGIVLGREILAQCKVKGVAVHKVSMAAACYCITCATIGISTSGPLYVAGSGWLASYVPAAYKSLVPDVVPLSETVLLPAIIIQCLLLGALTVLLVYAMMPKNAADILEISDDFANEIINASKPAAAKVDRKSMTPSQRMNTSIWLNLIVGGLGLAYSVKMLAVSGIVNLSVNNFNFIMLMLGVLLHKTPASFGKAVSAAVGSVSGVIIQFPFYAGIYGVVSFTGLTGVIADFFVAISNARTFPAITFVYSAILNFFVPSAGSKFIIEVPYIIPTAIDLGSSIPAVINAYSFGDYATNLIQPFWALPILACSSWISRISSPTAS
jgi:short-chain fatty acids transporter